MTGNGGRLSCRGCVLSGRWRWRLGSACRVRVSGLGARRVARLGGVSPLGGCRRVCGGLCGFAVFGLCAIGVLAIQWLEWRGW